MNKFIVVEVKQPDGEYVEDIEFVKSFNTYDEAKQYITDNDKTYHDKWLKFKEYNKEFVDAMIITPDIKNLYRYYIPPAGGTIDYKKKVLCELDCNPTVNSISRFNLKDYNPPPKPFYQDLRIVEVECD